VIMLALSMAVIAGMAGTDGLGKLVVEAISTVNIAKGVEAGLGIVLLAVYLDRVTAALGTPAEFPSSLLGMLSRRRASQSAEKADAPTPTDSDKAAAAGLRRAP